MQNAGHTYSKRLCVTNLGQEGQASYIYSLGSNLRNLAKKERLSEEDFLTQLCLLCKMIKNTQKCFKKYLFHHTHKRLTRGSWWKTHKNEEKSLLVSDWEWLPKAGQHPNAGCSFGIFGFFVLFSTCTSRVDDDVLWKTLLRMTQNVPWKTYYACLFTE